MAAELIFTHQPYKATLHPHLVGAENTRFISRIGGFQRNHLALATQALQRCLMAFNQSDDNFAILSRGTALDNGRVAIKNSGINRNGRLSASFQSAQRFD
jgi:hypothetical protein